MKKIILVLSLFLFGCQSSSADSAPIKLAAGWEPGRDVGGIAAKHGIALLDVHYLYITALEDVTITKIEVNRGNCATFDKPSNLKFGDKKKYKLSAGSSSRCDDVLEVSVEANNEIYIFTFNE